MTVAPNAEAVGSRRPAQGDMPDHETYDIGAPVRCEDGPCGVLGRVVVDPIKQAVTHLVVEPHHRHSLARLVPIAMVDADRGELRLRCTLAMFHALQYAEETEFLPPDRSMTIAHPGAGTFLPGAIVWPYWAPTRTMDRHEQVPLGEVEIRRGKHIHADDGTIGSVKGLVVEPAEQHVTHVLVQEGHLWGTKDVAIPISAVTSIDGEGVHVSLSKRAIADLPEIELAHSRDPFPAGAKDA